MGLWGCNATINWGRSVVILSRWHHLKMSLILSGFCGSFWEKAVNLSLLESWSLPFSVDAFRIFLSGFLKFHYMSSYKFFFVNLAWDLLGFLILWFAVFYQPLSSNTASAWSSSSFAAYMYETSPTSPPYCSTCLLYSSIFVSLFYILGNFLLILLVYYTLFYWVQITA